MSTSEPLESGRGDLSTQSIEAHRAPRAAGVVAVLVGALCFKLAIVVGLVSGTSSGTASSFPQLLWHLVSGGAGDAVVAGVVLALALKFPRFSVGVGVGVGVVSALQVYFAVTFGAPATWALLAYGSAVDPALLEAGTVGVTVGAVAVVVVLALVLRRLRLRIVGVVVAAVFVVGVVGRVVDDGSAARFGLSRSPVLALLPMRNPVASRHTNDDDSVDSVWPAESAARVQVLSTPPKHVVLFISESTASRFVDVTTMPTLTALAADHGLTFTDHVAESPVSIKALFALLCGLAPLPESVLETEAISRIDCGSLPEVLSSSGFHAGLFHGGYFAFTDKLAFLNERGFSTLVDGENVRGREQRWHNGWGVDDRAVVDEALAFLDERADRTAPSFVVVVPLIPHYEYFLPPDAPQPFGAKTIVDRYKNGLRFADDVLERLVDGYKARGLYDDSLFVVVGDHGEAFDEHPRNKLHGGFLFEENLRVPLVFHSPRALPAGAQRSRRPSSHADVAATILDIVDVEGMKKTPALQAIAGHSLVADDFAPRPTFHFTSYPDRRIAWRGAGLKLIADDDGAALFDLANDPREHAPLVDDRAARLQRQTERVLADRAAALHAAPLLDDGWLVRVARAADRPLVPTRVFNMVRPCIPFRASATDDVVITLPSMSPSARSVGIGIDAASMQRRLGAVHATIAGADGVAIEIVDVDSVFERSSRVVRIAPQPSLTVTIAAAPKAPAGCVWVAP